MNLKIFYTMAIVTCLLVVLIGFIGGECDTDLKEWLVIFTGISFVYVIGSALLIIWG